MDRSRRIARLCFILAANLTLICVILRSVCMFTCFEADIGYFRAGLLPSVCQILYWAALLMMAVCVLVIPKNTLSSELHTPARLPAAALVAISLAAFTVLAFALCYPSRTSHLMLPPMLLGLPASTYFFLSGTRGGRYSDWMVALGFLPILWCLAGLAETYTDQFTAMNSPIKSTLQMGFLGLMLSLSAELRFRLGKALPRVAVIFMSFGTFLCLNASIPLLLTAALKPAQIFRAGPSSSVRILHVLYAVVLFFGGLYSAYMLFRYTCFRSTASAPVDHETPSAPIE